MSRKSVIIVILVAIIAIGTVGGIVMDGGDAGPSGSDTTSMAYVDRVYGGIETGNGSPMMGDPSAPVTIVEFGDYQCHFCEIWHRDTLPLIKENYLETGVANLVFVDYAFLGNDSPWAAEASYCAEDQGMYWEYHDTLYNSQQSRIDGGWASGDNLRKFATDVGLDSEDFEDCMSSGKHADRVAYNTRIGSNAGVSATPAFFVIGQGQDPVMIEGAQPYGTFARVINSLR